MKNLNKTRERDFCVTNTEGETEQRTLHSAQCTHINSHVNTYINYVKKIVGILK